MYPSNLAFQSVSYDSGDRLTIARVASLPDKIA